MFTKHLSKIEVECGLIRFGVADKDFFPAKGETIVMVDHRGEEYITHVHRTVYRIDGLSAMHQNNNAHEGTSVAIHKIDGRKNAYKVIYQ